MSYDFRMPNIVGTDREQLAQIRSYLYQFTQQLQWAFNSIDTAGASNYVVPQNPKNASSASSPTFDAIVAFKDLKPLIIKSADIVQAYYDEINQRLEGIYVAESDFGTFIEKTDQSISQTSTAIEQNFSNIQQILTAIDNLNFSLAEVNAYIKSGHIDDNDEGLPIYGVEIKQRIATDGEEKYNKLARFTSDRLSFYDQNEKEVAYISDYKLYIRNVEITISFQIGGLVDTVVSKGDVVTRWVGGDS